MKIVLFKDEDSKWRARMVFSNGRIFATSEAYSSHTKALKSAQRVNNDSCFNYAIQDPLEIETKE